MTILPLPRSQSYYFKRKYPQSIYHKRNYKKVKIRDFWTLVYIMWTLCAMSIVGRLGMIVDITIFGAKKYEGLIVSLPETSTCQPLPNQKYLFKIWIDRFNNMVFEERTIKDISEIPKYLRQNNIQSSNLMPVLIVDERADAHIVNQVIQELRKIGKDKIYFRSLPTH